jgi:transcription elongation factor GreA
MQQAVHDEDFDRVEELVFEALEDDPIPASELLDIRQQLITANRKALANTILELLAEGLESRGQWDDALRVLAEVVSATSKPPRELLDRLVVAFRNANKGASSLDRVLATSDLTAGRKTLDTLATMQQWIDYDVGTVVEITGQGVGRVSELNLELANIKVDIGGDRPVSVPFGAVRRFLRVLPKGSFLWRKVVEPEALEEFVQRKPGEALVQVLESIERPAQVAAIKAALDGVLPYGRWTSWWGKARKHPRIVTSGSGSKLRYDVTASAEDAAQSLLDEARSKPPSQRLPVIKRAAERGEDAAMAARDILLESLTTLERSDPGLAWETAGVLAGLPGGADTARETRERLLAEAEPHTLLSGIDDRQAREDALTALREAEPHRWPELWAGWALQEPHPTVLSAIAHALAAAGEEQPLDDILEVIFRKPHEHRPQFVWACEAMVRDAAPEPLVRRRTASLLERIPEMLTRGDYADLRARVKGLFEGGQAAIRVVLEAATPAQATRFYDRIARLDVLEPARLRLLEQAKIQAAGSTDRQELPMLVATRRAVEAKQAELKELKEHEIPQVLKGINAAAAEGDLRENFEYHMLRDRQELLSARAAKIQQDLAQVRILEPGAADTSQVNIGTVVHFDEDEPLTILGSWDANLEERVYANGADIAQRLLGHKVGDTIEIGGTPLTITKIEVWNG